MKKIAILKANLASKGGLEHYTQKLIETFEEKKCHVTVLTQEGTCPTSKKVRPKFYNLVHFDKDCQKWLQEHPQDVIFGMERTSLHTHYRAGSGVHRFYLQQRKLVDPLFKKLTIPLNPLHNTILHLEKKCFENPTLKILFTNSKRVKEEILSFYDIPPEKIEVVYNGAPFYAWQEPFERTFESRKKEGSLDGPRELLFIGNGFRRKGLGFLLKALKGRKDFHLSVVGHDKESGYFEALAQGLPVTFYGKQSAPLPFYQKADVLCIPSIYDPCANVTLEALAMGLFVLTSCFNGAHELLTPQTGVVVKDLTCINSFKSALQEAFEYRKTPQTALSIRNSVKELDFRIQLDKLAEKTLNS